MRQKAAKNRIRSSYLSDLTRPLIAKWETIDKKARPQDTNTRIISLSASSSVRTTFPERRPDRLPRVISCHVSIEAPSGVEPSRLGFCFSAEQGGRGGDRTLGASWPSWLSPPTCVIFPFTRSFPRKKAQSDRLVLQPPLFLVVACQRSPSHPMRALTAAGREMHYETP